MGTPGEHYRASRLRLCGLLAELDADDWERAVPACPGWRVRDVVAHLAATVDDALAGRISGPPTDDITAEQVARHRDRDGAGLAEMVEAWSTRADEFEGVITSFEVWPAAFDMVSHEHDIRGAVGRVGFRDDVAVAELAPKLMRGLRPNLPVRIVLAGAGAPDDTVVVERAKGGAPIHHTLTTTPFEALRFGLGRRTPEQIRALDWSADPGPDLAGMWVFGPATTPVVE